MTLETFRAQRNTIRQTQIARSTAIAGASAAGASESSGLFGGLGQIQGLGTQALLAQSQNAEIGRGLFSSNIDKMNAEFALSSARTDQASAQGLMALGTSLVSNASQIGKNVNSASGLFSGT